tara:strand:+ start:868 stop:1116 length:249 start_codon:yes stop_codon:yes gene_type:complete
MKKFAVPVNWQVSACIIVEAENAEEAAHEAMGVDLDLIPNPEYVCDSFEVDNEVIEELPKPNNFDPSTIGDFRAWDKMPGGC